MAISKKVAERIRTQLKRYQTVLADAKARDISESDTVTILVDMLADVFGYNKYTDITKEFAIRGTYCDLAVKVGEDLRFLIEAKAINVELRDNHVKQAIDYAANHGIEWVVLTNGVTWQIYKVLFQQPIDKSLLLEWDVLNANPKDAKLLDCLANLTTEGFTQSSMKVFYQQQQAVSRFTLAIMLTSERVLKTVRKEIKRIAPKLKIEPGALSEIINNEVLKREVVDSDEAKQAALFLKKAAKAAKKAEQKMGKPPVESSININAQGGSQTQASHQPRDL